LAVKHTLLTRFTAFVVVDESETVNKDGACRTVVQPVEMPDRWEMQREFAAMESMQFADMSCLLLDAPEYAAETMVPGAGTVYGTTPEGAQASAPGDILGKVWRILGKRKPSQPTNVDHDFFASRKPLSKAQRATIDKAIAGLVTALKDARSALD